MMVVYRYIFIQTYISKASGFPHHFLPCFFLWSMFWINILWATNSDDGTAYFPFLWPLQNPNLEMPYGLHTMDQDVVLSNMSLEHECKVFWWINRWLLHHYTIVFIMVQLKLPCNRFILRIWQHNIEVEYEINPLQ